MTASTFGELTFPVANPTLATTDAAGDPLLTVLGAYLKTCVNADCSAAWKTLIPNEDAVRAVLFRDPNEGVFDDRDLPAIFLFRNTQNQTRIADDWFQDESEVVALWIGSPANLDRRNERASFANAIMKAIGRALTRGRDPRWVRAGDASLPDPAVFGSNVADLAGLLRQIDAVRVSKVPVTVERLDGSPPLRYAGVRAVFQTSELLEEMAADWPDAQPPLLTATLSNADGGTTGVRQGIGRVLDGGYPDTDFLDQSFDAGTP